MQPRGSEIKKKTAAAQIGFFYLRSPGFLPQKPKDQRTGGPEDQGTRGPKDHRTRGPEDQGSEMKTPPRSDMRKEPE